MSGANDDDEMFRALFRKLRRDPTVLRCGTVYVDVPGVVERRTACGDGLCWKTAGRRLTGRSCCTTFRVPVEKADIRRIEKVLPSVRAIRDVGAAIDRAGGFWRREDGMLWLRSRPDSACVFLSAPRGGPPLCTLHEWAATQGLDHRKVKPETCCLFPTYLVEWGDEVFITSYGSRWYEELEPEERDDLKSFACIHPPAGAGRSLLLEQADELAYRLGARRWSATLRKLRAAGHAV